MTNDQRRLVLVVDTDPRFVDDARSTLVEQRLLSARSLEEATEVVLGGRVDLVVLGPAFASDVAIGQARGLLTADPGVHLALVADVVTNRLLKAALRAGFTDVVGTPIQARDMADLVAQVTTRRDVALVVEEAPAAAPVPSSSVPTQSVYVEDGVAHPIEGSPGGYSVPTVAPAPEPVPAQLPTPPQVAQQPVAPVVPEVPQPASEVAPPVAPAVPEVAQPVAPVVPEVPQPVAPVVPEVPQPVAPVVPEVPQPVAPVVPEVPQPVAPVVPEVPQPVAPVAPESPQPVAPIVPEVPQPVAPVAPENPQPVAPVGSEVPQPVAPVVPEVPQPVAPPAPPAPVGSEAPMVPPFASSVDGDTPLEARTAAPTAPPATETVPTSPSEGLDSPPPIAPRANVLDQVLPPPPPVPPPTASPAPVVDDRPFIPRPSRPGDGRVIAVMAGKGGSGKTVVATNLAVALGLRGDTERIAIVDADLQFGDVALLLQIDPVRTLDDLVGHLDSMSDERLEAALLRHESGLRVLPAPVLPVRDGDITAKQIVEIVDRLKAMYDYVIVDTGPVFDEGLVTLLSYADEVISVVDMDLPSVKNAKVALDRLRQGGFDTDRVRLVVNRVNSKARLDLVELERSLGLRVGGSVPSDRLVPQSVNEGIPVLALSPRSKVARAFHALAESLDSGAERDRLNRR